jgi:hypothetical protein
MVTIPSPLVKKHSIRVEIRILSKDIIVPLWKLRKK